MPRRLWQREAAARRMHRGGWLPAGSPALLAAVMACTPHDPVGPGGDDGRVVWHVAAVGNNTRPAVDDSTAFFVSDGRHEVVAIEKSTGRVRWRTPTGLADPFARGKNIVVAGGVVVLRDLDIHAFDRRTGERRWMFQPSDGDEPGRGLLETDGETIYAASLRNRVYAIDAATGQPRWTTDLPPRFASSMASFSPTLKDGVLFVASSHADRPVVASLVALDAASGRILWTHDFVAGFENGIASYSGPAAFHGANVIAGVDDGRIHALDRRTGELRWTAPWVHPLPPEPWGSYGDWRPVVVVGDVVVAGSTSGTAVGLDAHTGAELWRLKGRSMGEPLGEIWLGVLVNRVTTDGRLVFLTPTDGRLYAVDGATGRVEWRAEAGPPKNQWGDLPRFFSPAHPDGDRLYISGEQGFYALRK